MMTEEVEGESALPGLCHMSVEKQGFSSFFKCTGEREKRKRENYLDILLNIFNYFTLNLQSSQTEPQAIGLSKSSGQG
jgi:hypothetical protein